MKPVPRNLVVCCDGTSNEIGELLSNVLKLYRIAEKSDNQLTFYQPGIGTIAMPNAWGRWRQKARSVFEMATGRGLDRDVLNAYRFLAQHYRDGDRIFLFGFSRGAYTVRVLAGMIYLIGLLREHQVNFAGYALKAYKAARQSDDYDTAREFSDVVRAQCVPIHFLGVWDTVASVIVPGRLPFSRLRLEELPFTTHNPAVRAFRHAVAIDEFRRMFRNEKWEAGQIFKPNRHASGEWPGQDSREVWFAGCHSDVGGGFRETESALSKFPLLWMLEQATTQGLRVRTAMINHIVKGEKRKGARTYQKPDPSGPLHNSMAWYWWLVEWAPKSASLRQWPRRKIWLKRYIPWAEPRLIVKHQLVHQSVYDRKASVKGYTPVNVPASHPVEPLSGPTRSPRARGGSSRAKATAVRPSPI